MQKYWNTVQDEQGRPRYGANVAVQQSGVNSTIYSDSSGLVPKANPISTDATRGYFEFYAAAGAYDLLVSGVGFAAYTISNGAEIGLPSGDVTFAQSGSGRGTVAAAISDLCVNVKNSPFSAVGDGTTDDTTAIQAAITYAQALGKSVFLPAGTYLISTTLTIAAGGLRMFGEGWLSILRVKSTVGATVDAIRVNFARMAQIVNNTVAEPGGGGFCYKITANASDTQILYNPTTADSTISTQLSDAGTRTCFMRHGISGYTELTRDLFFAGQGANIRFADTAGTAIQGVRWESADNTFKVGPQAAPASNGHCLLYAAGSEFARGNPTTLTFQTVSKIYPGTDAGARQTSAGLYGGSGVPNNANGADGDFYFRSDGTQAGNTVIYHRQAGAWVALVTT